MRQNVLVEGNLIREVAPSSAAPDGATVIDGGGRTLMPVPTFPGHQVTEER
jgi:imidazolonepropionase-like amidohydrolase